MQLFAVYRLKAVFIAHSIASHNDLQLNWILHFFIHYSLCPRGINNQKHVSWIFFLEKLNTRC